MDVKRLAIMCLAFVLCGVASAAKPNEQGGYIGLGLGVSEADDDGALSGLDFDGEDTSMQILGGYRFGRHFAIEGRYTDFGEFSLSDGFDSVDLELSAMSVHAVGIIPADESGFELFGQLGLGQINLEVEDIDEDETVGSAGLGVRYFATENLGIALQFDVYAWEESAFGEDYDFVASYMQLAVQYAF